MVAENDKAKSMSSFAVHTFIWSNSEMKKMNITQWQKLIEYHGTKTQKMNNISYVHNWWNNLVYLLMMLTSKLFIPRRTIKTILLL